jgi:hypothetical protein
MADVDVYRGEAGREKGGQSTRTRREECGCDPAACKTIETQHLREKLGHAERSSATHPFRKGDQRSRSTADSARASTLTIT